MNLKKIFLFCTVLTLCFSCKFKPAPIENHSHDFYTKARHYNSSKYSSYNSKQKTRYKKAEKGEIRIQAGDTLYGIAQQYNLNVRDLIEKNNLSAPYVLIAGTTLKTPTATYHKVESGETLYSISRDYGINLNEIVALNKMQRPYNIYTGQKIKVNGRKSDIASKNRSISYSKPKKDKPSFVNRILGSKNNKFSWPIKGQVISKFGPKKGGLYNDGINIKASSGSEVKSAEDGVVAYVGNELKGYGNLVILKHSGGWISAYGHLSKTSVVRGEKISKSQTIASVGATGNVDSPQLYFGLRKGRDAVNPEFYLKN